MAERETRNVSILRRNIAANGRLGVVPALLGAMLFAEFFLPRFALHFGPRELSVATIVTLVCVAMLVLTGGVRPDPTRIGLYCIAMVAMLIAAMLVCGAAGYGLGLVVGLAVALGLAGLFVGLVVGFALVYARFRRL